MPLEKLEFSSTYTILLYPYIFALFFTTIGQLAGFLASKKFADQHHLTGTSI